MPDIALDIHDIHKAFGRHRVLNGATLQVDSGTSYGIVGVNGAGKTTLIKLLLDFCSPDQGAIRIFSTPHTDPAARQRLAYLPERFNPPYFATGQDFLRLMCELHAGPFVPLKARELLTRLDLDIDALDQPVGEYSKGMAQKLGLVACLLVERDMLVLDEPMSGLDPKARALVKKELLARRELGQTLFFSTHLLQDVVTLCDKLAVLHAGRIVFSGSCDEFCQVYETDDLESAYLSCVGASADDSVAA